MSFKCTLNSSRADGVRQRRGRRSGVRPCERQPARHQPRRKQGGGFTGNGAGAGVTPPAPPSRLAKKKAYFISAGWVSCNLAAGCAASCRRRSSSRIAASLADTWTGVRSAAIASAVCNSIPGDSVGGLTARPTDLRSCTCSRDWCDTDPSGFGQARAKGERQRRHQHKRHAIGTDDDGQKSAFIFWKVRQWPARRARRSQKTGG